MPGATLTRGDSANAYLDHVSDLAVLGTAQGVFVAAASASEHGVSVVRLDSGGGLTPVAHLGQPNSVPVQGLTALEAGEVDGREYLIAAARGSSSLTVFAVSDTGGLSVTDHVGDALPTRFAGAAHLPVSKAAVRYL
ncbi:hypothetical protein [Aestuariicoccus sp. MJ-SS9]|uniref:hypothetical protein n=1 Tax=Aestuariicoccus sp. MJ-SS9 TaxID=3079855 RepID=UPI0029097B41|nr:hypothetical protein [Aestuariicoccus sp. MJ-SS9]MDU8912144.1 hypothetical protein [Aestuariicoccus sp. MJ-SS9]